MEYIGKPVDFGMTKRNEFTANDYHKPSDEIKPGWDLSGAVMDLKLFLAIGYRGREDASPVEVAGVESGCCGDLDGVEAGEPDPLVAAELGCCFDSLVREAQLTAP